MKRQFKLDPIDKKKQREEIGIHNTKTDVYKFNNNINDNILEKIKKLLSNTKPENIIIKEH